MAYYNHYNLDEIAEEMNAPHEVYNANFIDFPITIQDISRTYIKVIFGTNPDHPKQVQNHLQSIYSVGRITFREPDEFSIYTEFPVYDFQEFHNQIIEAIDDAFNPNL